MTDTAASIITKAMHLFGILDATENPTTIDLANNVVVLNDLLRAEQSDGACQYLIKRVNVTLPPGVSQQVYSFSVGTALPAYAVQVDAVAIRSIWMNDTSATVNRDTRMVSIGDVLRTTYPGIITKWHQERQADGSVLVTAFQPPRAASKGIIEYGGRVPLIAAADGSDVVTLPPEGIHDATLLLGVTICASYGKSLQSIPELAARAQRVNDRWRDWARGQQWLQFVRS